MGNGEAMQSKDYNDLDEVPEAVASVTAPAARCSRSDGCVQGQASPPYE